MATVLDTPDAQLPEQYEVVNGVVTEVSTASGFSAEVANRVRD